MVENRHLSGFEQMVKNQKLMTVIILFPYFNPKDLATFCQISKACTDIIRNYVNFEVLFKVWGIILTPDEVE
jgi:hypothetical protein